MGEGELSVVVVVVVLDSLGDVAGDIVVVVLLLLSLVEVAGEADAGGLVVSVFCSQAARSAAPAIMQM